MPIGDLAPELVVLLTAVAALLLAIVLPQRRHGLCAALAVAGLAIATGLAVAQFDARRFTFQGTYVLDPMTAWARLLILGSTVLVAGLAPRWFATDRRHGEYYAMLLFSALGAMTIAGAADLMQLVMGVLLSSVTGYVLAAYHRDWAISLEAGIKYFLMGALANALLVFGVILVMGMVGSTQYQTLLRGMPEDPLTVSGLALIVVGLFFKLGAVPGHAWVPDVAEGAPVPSAAFLTVVPKIAAAVALTRLVALAPETLPIRALVALAAAATMTLGNLSALWQSDVRRLIGWSSVSQAGYALMAVAVLGRAPQAEAALIAFVGVYAVANLSAFAVVAHLRGRTTLSDYSGLFWAQPFAIGVLTVAFLSLVGIPPLAGFFGKFALFTATIEGGMAWLALVAVVNTVISLFYYLRVIGPAIFERESGSPHVFGGIPLAIVAVTGGGLMVIAVGWQWVWTLLPGAAFP